MPYTRGAEASRPAAAVLAEARRLAGRGAREVALLGQNVNAYRGAAPGSGAWSLARLIAALAAIPGLDRIRYTTSHPRDMADDLIRAHGDIPELMPSLHLPVQSGSDAILKAMNRRYTAAGYLRLVERLREARPDIALSGDFIVGFPGETDRDFEATLELAREVGYASAFSFKYSPRPGTPAAGDRIPEEAKSGRLAALRQVLDAQRAAFNRATLGRTCPVLLERPGRHAGQLVGRSPWMQAVRVDAPAAAIGRIVDVALVGAGPNGMAGVVAQPTGEAA